MCDWYAGTAQLRRKYNLSSSRKLSARALSPWNVAGGDPCGRISCGGAGCPAPPAAGGTPPGDPGPPPPGGAGPPPPGGPDPPPPGGPHPAGPPDGGFGGSYFFMALPQAFVTRCSCVGAVVVNPTVSVVAVAVVISGSWRSNPLRRASVAF